jgi:SPP1 gp7 family putative phage head morphogenesis protein
VARQVGHIITGMAPDGEVSDAREREIRYALERYATLLRPWAKSVARYMLADVDRRNERAWFETAKEMGRGLLIEIKQAPTGMVFEALMQDQVDLITSLPTKAGQRVHELVTKGLVDSRRADEIAKDILKSGDVTAARATLIARTEVARAASSLTQARARYAGSEGYIWRSSEDMDVRDTHKKVNGKFFRWDDPPKTDKNLDPYHAGCGPNCRCFPEPVIPVFT